MIRHIVVEQRPNVADHAAPADDGSPVDPAAVAQYTATLLPAVLWLLGVYVFDGGVPMPLQGAVGLAVTGLCTALVALVRRTAH